MTTTLLHLSDLHFGTTNNAAIWYSQLAEDIKGELQGENIDIGIFSGDIGNFCNKKEYNAAKIFINSLSKEFKLDPKHIVIVPGNHDLNWDLSEKAYALKRAKNYSGFLDEENIINKGGDYVEVRNPDKYKNRFKYFQQFYQEVTGEAYSLDYEEQFTLHDFSDKKLLILGFNSAWNLDHHYKGRASIYPVALSNALDRIRSNTNYNDYLKFAVWHHPLNSPSEDRIKDHGFLEQLAKANFKVIFHGHVHKAENDEFRYDLNADGRKLNIICGGTFGAPTKELTPGYPWQYNFLRLDKNVLTVESRRREEENGPWKPDARWRKTVNEDPVPRYEIRFHGSPSVAESKLDSPFQHLNYIDESDVDTSFFYGRVSELNTLEKWVTKDNCRVVEIIGMGGIGKTSLALRLGEKIEDQFDCYIWQSLRNPSDINTLLGYLVQRLSDETEIDIPDDTEIRISRLLSYLRRYRCLVILDNAESILDGGDVQGEYLKEFTQYGELFRRIGEEKHKSCLLITSREKFKEFAALEGARLPVRSLRIKELDSGAVRHLFRDKGIASGTDREYQELIKVYAGNPLALKIVASHIDGFYEGEISKFLEEQPVYVGDIEPLLDEQFNRFSELEKAIMFWIAVTRESISSAELADDFVGARANEIIKALESLNRRSLTETRGRLITQQPVITEYATQKFIEQICSEIKLSKFDLLNSHPLIQAQSKDFVREAQTRFILKPIVDDLLSVFGSEDSLREKLLNCLSAVREKSPRKPGYLGGNILNIFCYLEIDIEGVDFSYLAIWQAYLPCSSLRNVNFSHSDLLKSSFADNFGSILTVAFSDNGEFLATGDSTGEVRLWQLPDMRLRFAFRAHTGWVRSVAFDVKSNLLASGSDDGKIILWDITSGLKIATLEEHRNRVRAVNFSKASPDEHFLASASDDDTIKLWDARTGECVKTFVGHDDHVRSVDFSKDGRNLISCSEDHTLKLWNIETGKTVRTFSGHKDKVCAVTFSPGNSLIASGSEDSTIKIWDVATGNCIKTLQGHSSWIWSLAFSPDGKLLASGSGDKTVKIWNVDTFRCQKTLLGHTAWLRSVDFSTDGQILVTGGDDQTVKFWNTQSGDCVKTLRGHTGQVWALAFSPSERLIVASSGYDQTINIWDVEKGKISRTLQGHSTWVWSIAFSPNGRILASGSGDKTIKLWDVNTGRCLNTLRGHSGQVRSIVYGKDGAFLISAGDDRMIKFWNAQTGNCFASLTGHTGQIWSLAINPSQSLLASGSDDRNVKIWNIDTKECINTLEGHAGRVLAVAFSFDGEILASGGEDRTIMLWATQEGSLLTVLRGHENWVQSVAFASDDQILGSGSDDLTVKLWEIETGSCSTTFSDHKDWVRAVASSYDGGLIASGSLDGSIIIWDVLTRENLKKLENVKPYNGMNINGITGLNEAQKDTLKSLGAIDAATLRF